MDDLERLLEAILKSDPSPGVLLLVLQEQKAAGRTGSVIMHCRKALRSHPDHYGLRILLAEALLESGLAGRASDELEMVTRGVDDRAKAYSMLAKAYERQGRNEDAAGCLDVYLAHYPSDREALLALERLRPPVPEAPAETPEAPDDDTAVEIATHTLAELYFNQGQIRAAMDTYLKILAGNPEDSKASRRLKELQQLTGAPPEERGGPLPSEGPATEGEPLEREKPVDPEKRRAEKLIVLLEGWLTRIRESGSGGPVRGEAGH
jgi:tetratricopeptide (TPR) repeat protein